MRIAVIGSWRRSDRDEWGLTGEAAFADAARTLGRRLVELGHSLVVGTDGHDTADYLAASAAADAAGATAAARVHILAPDRGSRPFEPLRRRYPRFFAEHTIPADDWAPAKIFQVQFADAVLVLAGAHATRLAGLSAAVAGRRIVAIGSFGGAANRLNGLFMQSRGNWRDNVLDVDTLGILQGPWSDALVDDVLVGLRATRRPRILIVHGRSEDRDRLKAYLRDEKQLPEPTVLADEIQPGVTIAAKFEEMAAKAEGAIALATPDDLGGLAVGGALPLAAQRARQNVWLEIGWFWGRLGLRRVAILTKGDVEVPSDLAGVERYSYRDAPQERAAELDAFLANVGDIRL
jgi:hypothetical protein